PPAAIYTLSLHDALPICRHRERPSRAVKHEHGEHRPRGRQPIDRESEKRRGADELDEVARGENQAAVETVGDLPRGKHENEERKIGRASCRERRWVELAL